MFVHEDHRRTLIEFGNGPFSIVKALTAKEDCVVGDHFHRNKDESFLLLSGHADCIIVGGQQWELVAAPFACHVPRGTYHRFHLRRGAVLIGTASEEFDEADEIKGEP